MIACVYQSEPKPNSYELRTLLTHLVHRSDRVWTLHRYTAYRRNRGTGATCNALRFIFVV